MATWKMTMGLALAGVMLAGSALAQATTRSPATGPESKGEQLKDSAHGTTSGTMKSHGMKSDIRPRASAPRGRRGSTAMADDEMVKAAQQALKEKGHDPGSVDGRMGPKTQQALRDFQNAQGIQATGELDDKTMVSLGVEPARTSSASESTATGSASPATSDGAVGSTSGTSTSDAPRDASGDAKK
jgi:peptidoglycan hydrolase-like protein with peptidoglycan-binding domain